VEFGLSIKDGFSTSGLTHCKALTKTPAESSSLLQGVRFAFRVHHVEKKNNSTIEDMVLMNLKGEMDIFLKSKVFSIFIL
jgi:hypothetical protein